MGTKTEIEWTDATWNPIRGCSKVSPGCKNCYAETMAARFCGEGQPYAGVIERGRWNGQITFHPHKLDEPLRWQKPRRVFVNSMSDLFHPRVTFETIAGIFGIMGAAPRHTFQILTKRPERAEKFFRWLKRWPDAYEACANFIHELCMPSMDRVPIPIPGQRWPLHNVWLGVSVEDQETADARVPLLLKCPAAVRWISAEPLLGPVDLWARWLWPLQWTWAAAYDSPEDAIAAGAYAAESPQLLLAANARILRWVVVGGESGTGARPMHPAWAAHLRDQCTKTKTPFLFKQWGAWREFAQGDLSGQLPTGRIIDCEGHTRRGQAVFDPAVGDRLMVRAGKGKTGRLLEGKVWDQYPCQDQE